MRISKTLLEVIVSRLSRDLLEKGMVSTKDLHQFEEQLYNVIFDDLTIEDRLDEEVRLIMEQHSDTIKQANVEYHEMFKTIKKKLIKERKLIL
jgi:hypothetical protein